MRFAVLFCSDEKTKIELIQYELKKVLTKGKSAGVLRLAFHDAGTFDSSDSSGKACCIFENSTSSFMVGDLQ